MNNEIPDAYQEAIKHVSDKSKKVIPKFNLPEKRKEFFNKQFKSRFFNNVKEKQ